MKTRVKKWGNWLALRIPKSFAYELGLQRGTLVDVSLANGTLVIVPVPELKFNLEQLLAKVNKENLHHGVETGTVMGKEVW